MGAMLHALHERRPIDHGAALVHYTREAALCDPASLAAHISRWPSFSAQELAALITALGSHAASMERIGLDRFAEVSELLDNAASIADESYFRRELQR